MDFDNNQRGIRAPANQHDLAEGPPSKKKIIESDGKLKEETKQDMSMQQYEEHYWPETKLSKSDGSYNMMEARTRALMEASGKSRAVASQEVKARMKKQGSENTNTDIADKVDEEEDEEEEEEVKKDTVEVCSKELDMLREKAKQLDILTEEKEKLEVDLETFKKDFVELKKDYDDKKAADIESKRQDIIERISKDFVVAKEEFESDSLEELQKQEKRYDMIVKRATGETEEPEPTEDFQERLDFIQSKSDELDKRYRHDP